MPERPETSTGTGHGETLPSASPTRGLAVVVIGASAGGLEACTALLDDLPAPTRTAFILVPHLDPTHASLMVGLLASHTRLQVVQAADFMRLRQDHLYVIPPAAALTLAKDVTQARLGRFFAREGSGYSIQPELRAMLVFTNQELLADPPFSRLDLVSCRNVMIYLGAEAQRQAIGVFHFALRPGGVLLLGSAEGVGDATGRFETISKPGRLYRHVGRSRPRALGFAAQSATPARGPAKAPGPAPRTRQDALAALCESQTLQTHAPATVLINGRHEFIYSLGPTDRYLRVAPGHASVDLLAMVGEDVRTGLRTAIQRVIRDRAPVRVGGGDRMQDGRALGFAIEVHPLRFEDEDLLLVHFIDQPAAAADALAAGGKARPSQARIAALERELKSAREDLVGAIRRLEVSGEEQRSINENARSVNEQFQSANEELLTSKEELQSLNEELTALNSQLQAALEQQRTTGNDLQNVLYSTDLAKLVLDADLRIRFFTPALKSLFHIIKTDIGRPLADLHSLGADPCFAADARKVLATLVAIEQEIETPGGSWSRRILPCRAHDGAVEGVIVTFTDITERKHAAMALEAAKSEAERATAAKSRFLSAVGHDLRQPLQTLALLQGLLASRVEGPELTTLAGKLDDAVGAMSGIVDTLLDINQIEAGIVQADAADFAVGGLLRELREAFTCQAETLGLDLRVVPCGLTIRSDARLLDLMLRNLVSKALKYTPKGKVLLGCRRSGTSLRIEVWDTGIGTPHNEFATVFEEHRKRGNEAHERARGLGLGPSIVSQLGALLGHPVHVRTRPGQGSMFSVEVPIAQAAPRRIPAPAAPNAAGLRARLGDVLPVITLTSDISTRALAALAGQRCRQLSKPVKPAELLLAIQDLLPTRPPDRPDAAPAPQTRAASDRDAGAPTIFLVDDDRGIRDTIRLLLEDDGRRLQDFATAEAFLAAYRPGAHGCLLIDACLPGMSGLALLQRLRAAGDLLPAIMITGRSDVAVAVEAMKAGAADFIEKPIAAPDLLAGIDRALERARDASNLHAWRASAAGHIAGLTPRQRQIMDLVLAGHPSKNIAADLGISPRTVENHRASIMRATGTKSLPALARLALAAATAGTDA